MPYCDCGQSTEADNKRRNFRLKAQIAIITLSSLIGLNHGMSLSHATVLVPQIQAENGTLQVDEDSASWIASVYSFASPMGCFLGGILCELFGRRSGIMIGLCSMSIGWLTISLSQSSAIIMVGRCMEGISKSVAATAITVLTDEAIHPTFRGFIFCNYGTMLSMGIFAMALLATMTDWRMSSLVASGFSLMSFTFVFLVPETPTWLVMRGKLRKAEKALHRLLGPSRHQQAREDLQNLINRFPADRASTSLSQKISKWKHFLGSSFLKPFLIIHTVNTFIQLFCGNHLVMNYNVDMVSRMAEHHDPYIINTILSVIRTAACCVTGFAMAIFGRRCIMMVSGVGCTISTIALAGVLLSDVSILTDPDVKEMTCIVLLSIYVASFSCGYFIVPALLIGETQPAAIRSLLCGYIYTINDFTAGGIIKCYPSLLRNLGLHGMFLMFGICSAICALFCYLFLPETRGKTLEEIEDYFKQNNIMWISRNKERSEPYPVCERTV